MQVPARAHKAHLKFPQLDPHELECEREGRKRPPPGPPSHVKAAKAASKARPLCGSQVVSWWVCEGSQRAKRAQHTRRVGKPHLLGVRGTRADRTEQVRGTEHITENKSKPKNRPDVKEGGQVDEGFAERCRKTRTPAP